MSNQLTVTPVVLEPAAQAFADATADPPYLFELGLVEGRKTFDEVQKGEIDKPNVDTEDTTVPGGPFGEVRVGRWARHVRTSRGPSAYYGPMPYEAKA
jgi:acetyl esterase